MPSFATSTVVHDNADAFDIQLHARYIFVMGKPSDIVYAVKDPIPSDLDVILQSDLDISLSGTFDRIRRKGRAMQDSAIAQHLLDYFHANSQCLGVRASPKVFLDEEDGNAKLTLSPTRPILERRSPLISLSTIDLLYVCKTLLPPSLTPGMLAVDPFSPNAFLPLVAALDRLVERFATHLVKQFPMIFGLWRERFDAEAAFFSRLSRALANIVCRSPHTAFRKRCRRVIKLLHESEIAAICRSTDSLRVLLSSTISQGLVQADYVANDLEGVSNTLDYCDTLSRTMERIYKTTSRSLRCKGLRPSFPGKDSRKAVDDFVLSECLDSADRMIQTNEFHNIGLDARVPAELLFDEEDADKVGGSQEDEDLFYEHNPNTVNDIDIWVSDEAESPSHSPLEDANVLWDSSQSTTLDDPMLDWADLSFSDSSQTSYPTGPGATFSDSCPRTEFAELPQDMIIDDEDDKWPVDQTSSDLDDRALAFPPAAFQLSESMPFDVDLAHNLHPSMHPSGSGCLILSSPPSQTWTCSPPFEETLDGTTSYFHILMDDDLEFDEASSSRSFPESTLPPPSLGTRPEMSCAQII